VTSTFIRTAAGAIAAAIALAGCATAPSVQRSTAPELKLLSAETLSIPRECELSGGAIYRTSYTVQRDGKVEGIASTGEPPAAQDCVQQALADWIATFRYAPVAEPTPAVIDWMATVARR
jgi:hypothetical protein